MGYEAKHGRKVCGNRIVSVCDGVVQERIDALLDRDFRLGTNLAYSQIKSEAAFQVFLEHLDAYIAEHGCAEVLGKHVCADGYRLGANCNNQRLAYKRGSMPPERVEALVGRGFRLEYVSREDRHRMFFDHLDVYIAEHGDADPKSSYVCADGYRLGELCVNRRQQFRSGGMPPEQEALLRSRGFRLEGKDRAADVKAAAAEAYGTNLMDASKACFRDMTERRSSEAAPGRLQDDRKANRETGR